MLWVKKSFFSFLFSFFFLICEKKVIYSSKQEHQLASMHGADKKKIISGEVSYWQT
jgi:hypothetical protein